MKYRLADGERIRTVLCAIESATEIAAGDLVAMTNGYIIKAVAASAAIGWTPQGSAVGDTVIEVSVGNDFTLLGPCEDAFAIAYQTGTGEYDINDGGTQTIDWDASSTDVLKLDISKDAGVVGATTDIRVRINKPLF